MSLSEWPFMGKKHESARLLLEAESIVGLSFNKDVVDFLMRKKILDISTEILYSCVKWRPLFRGIKKKENDYYIYGLLQLAYLTYFLNEEIHSYIQI